MEQSDGALNQGPTCEAQGKLGSHVGVRGGKWPQCEGEPQREAGSTPGEHCVSFLTGPGESPRNLSTAKAQGHSCALEDILALCGGWTGSR